MWDLQLFLIDMVRELLVSNMIFQEILIFYSYMLIENLQQYYYK